MRWAVFTGYIGKCPQTADRKIANARDVFAQYQPVRLRLGAMPAVVGISPAATTEYSLARVTPYACQYAAVLSLAMPVHVR